MTAAVNTISTNNSYIVSDPRSTFKPARADNGVAGSLTLRLEKSFNSVNRPMLGRFSAMGEALLKQCWLFNAALYYRVYFTS